MLDDFFMRAMVAGLMLAAVAGPLGCFVIWRRLSYFGDTMAHAALLGVALAVFLQVDMLLGVGAIVALVAVLLVALRRRGTLSADTLLGILSHGALAVGLVMIGFMDDARVDLMALLFGDLLAVDHSDILVIAIIGAGVLVLLWAMWQPLLAATLNHEIAEAEGQRPQLSEMVFVLLIAGVIAVALKIVGALLITALLIIPAAAARWLSRSPEIMAVLAALLGMVGVAGGLWGSLQFDSASGPSIVVCSLLVFMVCISLGALIERRKRG
ncbi:iron chelate uptake ABC transporter family permease subunit [Polycladidibacter hongkongensis]|uniref:iron chelate uptake ABC transporter family permease subunit n=1 Tax=Polycladidibacter hongkongensis TaxID=1647556 RepID=UPI00082FE68F|nr:iron chelate uptake ABC transporter family permease subunit [Pseudovibrio hongkongensis]